MSHGCGFRLRTSVTRPQCGMTFMVCSREAISSKNVCEEASAHWRIVLLMSMRSRVSGANYWTGNLRISQEGGLHPSIMVHAFPSSCPSSCDQCRCSPRKVSFPSISGRCADSIGPQASPIVIVVHYSRLREAVTRTTLRFHMCSRSLWGVCMYGGACFSLPEPER